MEIDFKVRVGVIKLATVEELGERIRKLEDKILMQQFEERIRKLEEKVFMQDKIITEFFDYSKKFMGKDKFTQEDHIKIKLLKTLGRNFGKLQELKKLEKESKSD